MARVDRLGDHIVPDIRMQREVQKARPCHLGHRHARVGLQPGRQIVGDGTGRGLGGLCQHHRGIGGHVAMGGVTGRLHRDGTVVQPRGQRPVRHHGVQRLNHQRADLGEDVHAAGPGSRWRVLTTLRRGVKRSSPAAAIPHPAGPTGELIQGRYCH